MGVLKDARLAMLLTKARHACAAYGHLPSVVIMWGGKMRAACPNCGKEE